MDLQKKSLNLNMLPFDARKELLDFYEFLRIKYKLKRKNEKLPDEFYNSIKVGKYINYKRMDIYNEI